MKKLHSTVKLRLILVCILIGTIPAIIVGSFSYYKAAEVIQAKVDSGNADVLTQTEMAVEQLLKTSDHILWQFIQSPAVKGAIDTDMNGNEFRVFSNAEDAINSLPTFDLGVSDICLANLEKRWVIDGSGIYRFEDYGKKTELNRYLGMPGYSFWVNDPDRREPEDPRSTKSKEDADSAERTAASGGVSLVKKYPLFTSDPSVIVVMRIPYSRLSSLISTNSKLGDIMILESDGSVIAYNDKTMQGRNLSDSQLYQKIKTAQTPNGNFTIRIDNVSYSVNYIKSSYNDWIYLSMTSLEYVTRDSKAIGWFTLIICIVIIALVILTGYIVTNRMYRPISKVYNMVRGIPEFHDEAKQKDELGLIEERVKFILKDQERLQSKVYSQLEQLEEFFILKLILNEMEKDLIEARLKLYGYTLTPVPMYVLLLRIDTLEGTQYKDTDRDLMLFSVNNMAGEILNGEIVLKPVVIDDCQITILGNENRQEEELRDFAFEASERIQQVVKNVLGFTVSIGISRPVRNYSEIHRGYLDGIEALKQQILLGYNAVVFYEDIPGVKSLKPVFPDELEQELLNAVKMCDASKAQDLLHEFIERVFQVEVNRYEYQYALIRLLSDLSMLVRESGNSPDILVRHGKSVFEQLLTLKTAGEIESWLGKFVLVRVIECNKKKVTNQHKKIVDDTLAIIHEEYDTELTLESCAARLNYHPSYIRRVLKNEAGIAFRDYLALYRMDMAKKLLMETDLKISDISEKLKYRNPENFIRSFKKVEGITPGQYRDKSRT
jgi:AraC-like DNA-binding protein